MSYKVHVNNLTLSLGLKYCYCPIFRAVIRKRKFEFPLGDHSSHVGKH
jgi:hypothetical protein